MIVLTAQLSLKEGSDATFEHIAQKLVEASRQEPGCAGYELLKEAEGSYCFLERYVDEDAVNAHRKTDHYRTLGRQMGPLMEGTPTVVRYISIT